MILLTFVKKSKISTLSALLLLASCSLFSQTAGVPSLMENQLSGKCLDDTGASTQNGNLIQQWTCDGYQQQSWKLTAVGGGYYTISNQLSGKCLDDTGASIQNGIQMQQWTCNGQGQQNWLIQSGFNILVDTNQMGWTEAVNSQQFQPYTDGVWALTWNSCTTCSIPDPIPASNQNSVWQSALLNLKGNSWAVMEGGYPANQNLGTLEAQLGRTPNAIMSYVENPLGSPNDTVLCTPQEYPQYNTPTNSCPTIDSQALATNVPIVVNARSYADQRGSIFVTGALSDSYCSGVSFEADALTIYQQAHCGGQGQPACQNFNQGINATLAAGRKVFVLMPPSGNWSNGNTYAVEALNAVSVYLSQSSQLWNPNLYVVLADYGRGSNNPGGAPPNGVGFLNPDPVSWAGSKGGITGNSILAATKALQSYRMSLFGR